MGQVLFVRTTNDQKYHVHSKLISWCHHFTKWWSSFHQLMILVDLLTTECVCCWRTVAAYSTRAVLTLPADWITRVGVDTACLVHTSTSPTTSETVNNNKSGGRWHGYPSECSHSGSDGVALGTTPPLPDVQGPAGPVHIAMSGGQCAAR